MPSSHPAQIGAIMQTILELKPDSVLDIGIGFGKYGFLCREYLELWDGREQYNDWHHTIDGIESFAPYVDDLQRKIYSDIHIGDVIGFLSQWVRSGQEKYDLVLLIDVLEHFTREDGEKLLELIAQTGHACLISTPKNPSSQGVAFGNPKETHLSRWFIKDFVGYKHRTAIMDSKSLIYLIVF